MIKIDLITALIFIVAWVAAYLMVLRPLLMKYSVTAGVLERLDAAEGDLWKKIGIWLEAKKTLAVVFLTSLFAAGKGAIDTTVSTVGALQPTDLAPLQDRTLWSAFFGDIVSFHIIAALSLLAAVLTLKGKVAAAQITPKD